MTANSDLLARRLEAVPRGIAVATPVFAERALNAELWDADGKRYVDFAGGIAVLNTGHRHPKVMAAVAAQLERFTHTAYQVLAYEPYVALAERLNAAAPISGPVKTALFTTGAEAVENAVKIARAATKRSAVIAFTGGFHGRTYLTMGLTGKIAPYKKHFGPMPADVFHVPFPIAHYGVSPADSLRALDTVFRSAVDPERVAAVIIEPVQGEGGFHMAGPEFLAGLRAVCDTHGIVLIADEIQTGFARTGKLFAVEHAGIEPDLITAAKSLAGGFPLSAVIGRARIMDAAEPGGLGGTYAGSPVACAAALAVLDVIADENLAERANVIGKAVKARLTRIADAGAATPIAHVRGPGAMIAFDLVTAWGGDTPDGAAAKRVTAAALDAGLILLGCGIYGETIRLLMPLTIADDTLAEGLDRLETALMAARRS